MKSCRLLTCFQLTNFGCDQIESIICRRQIKKQNKTVVKGENAGYQLILLFPICIPKPSSLG